MNADQLKGKWMQFKGGLKQKWGKFTHDDLQQIEGTTTSLSAKERTYKVPAGASSGLSWKLRGKKSAVIGNPTSPFNKF